MLYDKRWDKTKADPFSLEGLVAWLEMRPAAEGYDWDCVHGGCLIGLYGDAMKMGMRWHDFHHDLFQRNLLHIASTEPYTFGAALTRAKAALAAQS